MTNGGSRTGANRSDDMYNKVLVTLDGSRLSECAIAPAAWIACVSGSEEITLLRITESGGERARRRSENYLKLRAVTAMEADVRNLKISGLSSPTIKWASERSGVGKAASAIIEFSESYGADLVVMSTHGRSGADRWLMGSVAEKVLRGADVPVMIVPDPKPFPTPSLELKKILLPLDGSDLAESALASVEQLARVSGVEVILLHVEPPKDSNPFVGARGPSHLNGHHRADVDSYLASVSKRLVALGASVEVTIREGLPGLEIIDAAEDWAVDLIVMSSHGRTGLAEWAFGSTADQALRLAAVPVLLIRAQSVAETPTHLRSSLVYRCHHCRLRTVQTKLSSEMRCIRCNNLLKTCGNCAYSDGLFCLMQRPEATDAYPGNSCKKFEFRKTPAMLH